MAFKTNNNAAATRSNNIPEGKKAVGYINIYLPTPNGKRKLGAITLRTGYQQEATLAEWLEGNPEVRAKKLLASMIVEYNSATLSDASAFQLPPDDETPAADAGDDLPQ